MSNKVFISLIVIALGGFIGVVAFQKQNAPPPKLRLGYNQADEGREHLQGDGQYTNYKAKIPTSGPHATQPVAWQAYDQQVPDQNVIHNMEHGGVVISYRPDLDPETIQKLKSLFTKPYSNKDFSPNKAVVMPREGQEKPIVMASWLHVFELDKYDEQTLKEQYLMNIGKSPEPGAS